VFDRTTGTFTAQHNAALQFRSASVMKVLIALDHLWDRGTPDGVPAKDRQALDRMLRSSDDAAAGDFYRRGGRAQVITRMVSRLKLEHTAPPPAGQENYWGYTAISAADTVRVYRYVLDKSPAPVRDYVLGRLRESTRCGTDGFDQSFGIPTAFQRPWAVKQGWSGFGASGDCVGKQQADTSESTAPAALAGLDLERRALHTTGTVGADNRYIVAVLTLHPVGTSFGAASTTVTALVRALPLPGATPAPGTWFGTWGNEVRVRATPSTSAAVVAVLPGGIDVAVKCQKKGQLVHIDQYTNDWWAYLPDRGGYMTNIYVRSPGSKLPGVPDC
jgi:hypothetical protein